MKRAAAALCAFGAAWSCGTALAAEFEFHPSLGLSEEYSDNILETSTGRKSDFVTRVLPGASLLYRSGSLSADARYTFEYRHFAKGWKEDEEVHTLALGGHAALFENFLFVDVSDSLSRRSLDVTRDTTTESLFSDQTDENRATVSPYLLWRLAEKITLKTGYRYTDVRYWEASGATESSGSTSAIDRREHRGYADLTHELTARLSLNASYSYGSVNTDIADYTEHNVSGGARFEYADKCFVYGSIGNSWQDFDNGRDASNFFWNAGVTHDFVVFTGTLEGLVRYSDDPLTVSTKETRYSATLEKRMDSGTMGFSVVRSEFDAEETLSLAAESDRKVTAINLFTRQELSSRLAVALALTGDKVTRDEGTGYPYHFSGSASVTYSFPYEISTALTYTHTEYRYEIEESAGGRQTNRVILDVRKVF
ncbi:TIGR03016 family PEP-CTERM system-associated outer membrane protein [Geomonas sp. RF6]|uniref:TIGR03016 family PEP-CTERM system-associated outer membrane protein n=1 Tax=Geomonas sp. RF6 TaxID=2897342 RepID=UPI001E605E18|nr:TIGR03016 family PEP-CTERM system-associated outer membrane protein [Geomonas sp. RF6]UFS69106.1 TIGR03016 family PEP-CTERM system-associated outer membrane protein [Geomonas sp. RF6]